MTKATSELRLFSTKKKYFEEWEGKNFEKKIVYVIVSKKENHETENINFILLRNIFAQKNLFSTFKAGFRDVGVATVVFFSICIRKSTLRGGRYVSGMYYWTTW